MAAYTRKWLFRGGKVHYERRDEYKPQSAGNRVVHMLCGLPVWNDGKNNGEHVVQDYSNPTCKSCVRISKL